MPVDVHLIDQSLLVVVMVFYALAFLTGVPLLLLTWTGKVKIVYTFIYFMGFAVVMVVTLILVGTANKLPLTEIFKAFMWFTASR